MNTKGFIRAALDVAMVGAMTATSATGTAPDGA